MRLFSMLLTTLILISSNVYAKEAVARIMGGAGNCEMKETVTININFNLKASSLAEAKKMFDDQSAKVAEFAKAQSLSKLDLQSQSYNINTNVRDYDNNGQPMSYSYQVSGSSSYKLDNAEAAFKFAEFLAAQKIQVGLNSSSYRQGNCDQ